MAIKLFDKWASDPKEYIAINEDHIESIRQGTSQELFDMAPVTRAMRVKPPGCIITMVSGQYHVVSGSFSDIVAVDAKNPSIKSTKH